MNPKLLLVTCATLTLTSAAEASDVSRYVDIAEWFEEQPISNPSEKSDHQRAILKTFAVAQVEAVAQNGEPITIKHIEYPLSGRVSGDNPDCGDGKQSDASAIGSAFLKGGAAMVSASAAGGPGAPFVAAIGAAIAAVGWALGGETAHSATASCGFASLVLPGHYTEEQVRAMVQLNYQNSPGDSFEVVSPDQDVAWARVGTVESKPEDMKLIAGSDFAQTLAIMNHQQLIVPTEKPSTCPQTLVLVRFKNWSHNRDRTLFLSTKINKAAIPDGSCLDSSYINKFRYGSVYVNSLGPEVVGEYFKWLRTRISKVAIAGS